MTNIKKDEKGYWNVFIEIPSTLQVSKLEAEIRKFFQEQRHTVPEEKLFTFSGYAEKGMVWEVIEGFYSFSDAQKHATIIETLILKIRKRQVRDALNKCASHKKIEKIEKILV